MGYRWEYRKRSSKIRWFYSNLPGRTEEINGEVIKPIYCKVKSLCADKNKIDYAIPGGLTGIGTTLDQDYTKVIDGRSNNNVSRWKTFNIEKYCSKI